MASGTLYTYPENFRAYKALIAAQYSGSNVKLAPGFVFGETNKSKEFLKKFPLGKVPAFETSDGQYLTESNAIAYYVSNKQLQGKTDFEKAQILQWLGFADSEILPASCTWVFPCLGIMQYNKQSTERAKEDVKAALNTLNTHLLTRTYLVGERISLADIGVACTLLHLYQYVLGPAFRKPFQNVNRWFTTIVNQPEVKAVIGEFKLCEKMAEFDAKKFAEHQAALKGSSPKESSGGSAKKEKKKEKQQQEKEVSNAAEPAEPAERAEPEEPEEPEELVEEMDSTEMIRALEPKSKDPFEALPKGTFTTVLERCWHEASRWSNTCVLRGMIAAISLSTFNMDEFKRCYSNEEVNVSVPFFWEKFDAENYSIWLGEYKYNDELQKVFMSCNLISGMYQRLDKMRKNAFASMCIFGTDNNSSISGIWVWRGQNLAFELSPDWTIDYESYQWSKLDPTKEVTKILVQQHFSWTGTDKQDRQFNQGKIFK